MLTPSSASPATSMPVMAPYFEREFEFRAQRRDRGLRRTHVRAHRHVHADEARGTPGCPDGEADTDEPTRATPHDQEDHDADNADGRVLTLEIGLRPSRTAAEIPASCAAGIRTENEPGPPRPRRQSTASRKR